MTACGRQPARVRVGAALALTLLAPGALGAPPARDLNRPRRLGEGVRVVSAPLDLPPRPDVVEVARGLVWLKLADGDEARTATKVPGGVYLTSDAWRNASEAFEARGARIREMEAALARMVPADACPQALQPVALVEGEAAPPALEAPRPVGLGPDGVSVVGKPSTASKVGAVGVVLALAGAFVGGLVLGVKLASK